MGRSKHFFRHVLFSLVLLAGAVGAVASAQNVASDTGDVGGEVRYEDPVLERMRNALKVSPLDRQGIAPVRLTLQQCIRLTLQHNAKVRSGDYAVDAAKAQLSEAYATGWPVFEYEYQTAPVPRFADRAIHSFLNGDIAWHSRGKLTMGIPLYTFGKLRVAQELARQGIAGAYEQQAQEQTGAVAKVRQLYYGIQLGEEIAHILTEAIDVLGEKIAERQEGTPTEYPESRASPIDRLRLRAFRGDLEKRLAETRMKQELAVEGLRVQIGLSRGAAVTLAHRRLAPVRYRLAPLTTYQQAALVKRPEAQLVEVGVHAKRLQADLERRKILPDVGVGGFFEIGRTIPEVIGSTATDDYSSPFHYTRFGIGLQLKGKFDWHGHRARVAKAESEYRKASVEQGIAKEGIQLEVKEAYLKAQYAFTQIQRLEDTQKIARQLLFLTKSNMDLGLGEKQEYVDALQLQLLTQSQYYEAVFNYNIALAELDQKVGLVPDIGSEPQLSGSRD